MFIIVHGAATNAPHRINTAHIVRYRDAIIDGQAGTSITLNELLAGDNWQFNVRESPEAIDTLIREAAIDAALEDEATRRAVLDVPADA